MSTSGGDAGARTPPTRRGVHERLAHVDVLQQDGFDARRTMPARVELRRQLLRRRTQLAGGLLVLLPILIALAFKASGATPANTNGAPALVDLATVGAANFALFTEYATVGFLLVVIVALFCGDTVASEASWSSLRYLLVIPVPRSRLLRQKLLISLLLATAANVFLPAWAYLVGGAFFGWAPARSPLGGTFTFATSLERLLIVVAYVSVQALLVAGLAFLFSVLTDAPLGAVGGATLLVVVSNILDSITALGRYRRILPTHFQYSWLDALGPNVVWDDMLRGTGLVLCYAAVLFGLAWWRFERKDITS